jgi:hypothetical protein
MTANLRDVVRQCFLATHSGHSSDDIVIDDRLNAAFISACQGVLPSASALDLNWQLLNLRKQQPGLGRITTVRRRDRHDDSASPTSMRPVRGREGRPRRGPNCRAAILAVTWHCHSLPRKQPAGPATH